MVDDFCILPVFVSGCTFAFARLILRTVSFSDRNEKTTPTRVDHPLRLPESLEKPSERAVKQKPKEKTKKKKQRDKSG
jgi:hypothetical protein